MVFEVIDLLFEDLPWPILLVLVFSILVTVFVFLFRPMGFIVSMLFSRRRHRKMIEQVKTRIAATVEHYGRDPLTNKKSPTEDREISDSMMVQANYVLGPGWFNQFIAFWHSVFGGKINAFDDVLMLARQECLQSLRDQAAEGGYDEVLNVRLDTARLTLLIANAKANKYVEIFAYGTAIKYA